MHNQFYQIIVSAVLVENVWTITSGLVDAIALKNSKLIIKCIASLFIGVLIAINYNINLPGVIGLTDKVPYIGQILTGVLISRGSTFVHDLLKMIENIRNNTKNNNL